jgi:hypothetical protein
MTVTLEDIKENLAAIVRKSPNGVGWYGAEMRCPIPRSEFPDGMNVQVVLEAMTEGGTLIKRIVEGKEKYFAADADLASKMI